MKRKELVIIVAVALVTAIISMLISGALFGNPNKNPIKVPEVDKISADFPSPDNDETYAKIYNLNAINPTQLIRIGTGNNSIPFQETNR
jgi:hypothetical protein